MRDCPEVNKRPRTTHGCVLEIAGDCPKTGLSTSLVGLWNRLAGRPTQTSFADTLTELFDVDLDKLLQVRIEFGVQLIRDLERVAVCSSRAGHRE